ncbi:MAG: hypothetical protein ABT07_01245 [Microbacterium sp. SCN 70-10]|nr:MAG: hypothetical protein ABT07_01245 [Microbacterium sp. SCN 70-10]
MKNIRYLNPRDDRYVVWLEGNSDIPDMGNTPADVQSLVIDGLHIQDDACRQTKPYIAVDGRVRHCVVRNSDVLLSGVRGPVSLVETRGELAKVDSLAVDNLSASGLAAVVRDDGRAVKALALNGVQVRSTER